MKLFKYFVKKEILETFSHKKAILFLFLFMLYPPILNVLEKDPIFPVENIIPLFFLFSVCFPSDFIYNIMNNEIDKGTYDILYISKVNRIELMISKIAVPVLFGFMNMVLSLFLDYLLLSIFHPKKAYYGMLKLENIVFLSLSILFTSLLTFTVFDVFRIKIKKNFYTLLIFMEFLFLSIIFEMARFSPVYYVIIIFVIFVLFFFNTVQNKNYNNLKTNNTCNNITSKRYWIVLLHNSYKHTVNLLGVLMMIIIEISAIIFVYIFGKNFQNLIEFLFLLLIVFNSNLIVFKKRIIDRINKIDEIIPLNFKIGTFVLIDLLPALTINLLLFFLVYILQINSNIYYIISLFLLTISSVLLAYLLGDIIDINYHRQINAVVMTMFMLVSGAFMYVRKPAFLIAELLFILFIILIMRKSK